MDLRTYLDGEFRQRRLRNPRYSLRAFAKSLGANHSTLSRLLRGNRRVSLRCIATLGRGAGLTAVQLAEVCALEQERSVLALTRHPGFRADCRWIATMTGISIDDVNRTLQRLLRTRRLTMFAPHFWRTAP